MAAWRHARFLVAFWPLLFASAWPQQAAAPSAFTFDVASIRRSANTEKRTRIFRHPDDTEFVAANVGLRALLQFAFGVSDTRVLGVPPQLESARFDVQAKGDIDTDARFRRLNPEQARTAKQAMMQKLLAERFQLTMHFETRELPVYALVVAKGGAKLQTSDEQYTSGWSGWTHINVEGGDSLNRFAEELTRVAGRPVVNRTGLTGHYNIEFEWSDDDDQDSDAATLFTAIREQLGLRLEPQKAPVQVVVVDRIALPSPN
jgi:uncharacterized protein (TIGR03435 family)